MSASSSQDREGLAAVTGVALLAAARFWLLFALVHSDVGRYNYQDESALHGSSGNVMGSPCKGFSIENSPWFFQMKIAHL